VAARKVTALWEAGARPVVISPALCESLRRRAERSEIEVIEREYCLGDLEGARLAIVATDNPTVNEAVWREAESRGCLVNVVDDREHCNFYVPANVRRGALTISISTGGSSPMLARRLRETLETQFDAAYDPFLALLGELRPLVQAQIADSAQRKALWTALLDSDILRLFRDEKPGTARQRAFEIVGTFSEQGS
jgi:precorrin-2 dehydrogenase/sirohydrochlorin ferrochelatase